MRRRWDRDISEDVARATSVIEDSAELGVEENVDKFWGNELEAPILFPPREASAASLTIQRMSVPEPKIDEEAWRKNLEALYESVSQQAGESIE